MARLACRLVFASIGPSAAPVNYDRMALPTVLLPAAANHTHQHRSMSGAACVTQCTGRVAERLLDEHRRNQLGHGTVLWE